MYVKMPQKLIYGKKIRTNNQNPGEIIELWGEIQKSKLSGDLYAVYSNYVSDYTDDYDLLVGSEKENEKGLLPASVKIEAGDYYVIEVDHTDPQGVVKTWQHIWSSDIPRTYRTDFEHYAADGTIHIYLSV